MRSYESDSHQISRLCPPLPNKVPSTLSARQQRQLNAATPVPRSLSSGRNDGSFWVARVRRQTTRSGQRNIGRHFPNRCRQVHNQRISRVAIGDRFTHFQRVLSSVSAKPPRILHLPFRGRIGVGEFADQRELRGQQSRLTLKGRNTMRRCCSCCYTYARWHSLCRLLAFARISSSRACTQNSEH